VHMLRDSYPYYVANRPEAPNDFDAVLGEINNGVYGLQAGIFTRDLYTRRTKPGNVSRSAE